MTLNLLMTLLTLVWVRMGTKLNPQSNFFKQLKIRAGSVLFICQECSLCWFLAQWHEFLRRAGICPSRKMTIYSFACYFFETSSLCMYAILKYSILIAYLVTLFYKYCGWYSKEIHLPWKNVHVASK